MQYHRCPVCMGSAKRRAQILEEIAVRQGPWLSGHVPEMQT